MTSWYEPTFCCEGLRAEMVVRRLFAAEDDSPVCGLVVLRQLIWSDPRLHSPQVRRERRALH